MTRLTRMRGALLGAAAILAALGSARAAEPGVTDNEILTIGGKSTCASEGAGSYKIQPAQSAAIGGGAAAANAGAALAVAGAVATAVVVSVATEEDDPEDKLDQLSP